MPTFLVCAAAANTSVMHNQSEAGACPSLTPAEECCAHGASAWDQQACAASWQGLTGRAVPCKPVLHTPRLGLEDMEPVVFQVAC